MGLPRVQCWLVRNAFALQSSHCLLRGGGVLLRNAVVYVVPFTPAGRFLSPPPGLHFHVMGFVPHLSAYAMQFTQLEPARLIVFTGDILPLTTGDQSVSAALGHT